MQENSGKISLLSENRFSDRIKNLILCNKRNINVLIIY